MFSEVNVGGVLLTGSPINCWSPANHHPAWVMYADNVCFVNKTYYIAEDSHVTLARAQGDVVYVEFYQWYPVILVLMAVLFYAPQMFWTGMLNSYGMFWQTSSSLNPFSIPFLSEFGRNECQFRLNKIKNGQRATQLCQKENQLCLNE